MTTYRRRRHLPLEHVLVAGGPHDLEAMRALLALLPTTAYGQVFVEGAGELAEAMDLRDLLGAPARMTITRLAPGGTDAHPADSALATRGLLLAEAVTAWAAEWIPDEPTVDRIVSMWVGGRGSDLVDALCRELPHPVERL